MTALAEKQAGQVAESNTVSMFERLARDPQVDVEKIQRLMELQERVMARQSEQQFAEALSAMQTELPSIGERGNAAGRYTYALWEDINTAIKPVLSRFGFALSFRTDFTNGISVTGVLSHRGGHKESTSITLPSDPSGNKNAVQAVASSVSYGKRYTAGALLNLTSHGEDDDAYRAGGPELISEDQAATLNALMEDVGADKTAFLRYLKLDRIEDMRAKAYPDAVAALNQKRKAASKGKSNG